MAGSRRTEAREGLAEPGRPDPDRYPDCSEELAAYAAGSSVVAGVDEAGRGAWAGPVVAAAVVLSDLRSGVPEPLQGVDDSKALTPARRELLYGAIRDAAVAVGVGVACADDVDLLGLTAAGELAMHRAVRELRVKPDLLLVDGFRIRSYGSPQKAIVHGDSRCLSIAAASIVAKVYRDRWLRELDARYAGYDLASNKGYGAVAHRRGLDRIGIAPIHRRSYAPIARTLADSDA